MGLKRLLHTEAGKNFISILLGFGLAAFFRTACLNRKCIVFRHPDIKDINKTHKSNGKCYKYDLNQEQCNIGKRVINT